MNELNEIIGHLEGIKGILPQMEGVPLTPNNAKIVLAISNSVNIIAEKVQAMAKELADLKGRAIDARDPDTATANADKYEDISMPRYSGAVIKEADPE